MEYLYEKLKPLEPEARPLSPRQRLKAVNGPLLSWYESHARVLPWREDPQPYKVWISEIMLQQTRVEAVKPYFNRFMEEFPDVRSLARADDDRLLKAWEGLGYYNRARNLKKAACLVTRCYGGRLPDSYEELLKLPGVGTYTAGAIASIAYGLPVPAVDGNVLRVLSRVLASREDILKQSVKRQMETLLRETMPKENVSAYNQGLIEVGAVVCVPGGPPKCQECPMYSLCLARRQGLLDSIPYKSPRKPRRVEKRTILLLESGTKIALEKRPDTGLLASLYQFPNLEGRLSEGEVRAFLEEGGACPTEIGSAGEAKHIFSHVEWRMTGYRVRLAGDIPDAYLAVEKEDVRKKYPIPNAFLVYTKQINGES